MKKALIRVCVFILVLSCFFTGWPSILHLNNIPIAQALTETIRPTDAFNVEAWSNPSQGYDANTGTSAAKTNINKAPSISFGAGNLAESTNAWAAKSQSWDSATLYYTFSRTAASNDTIEVIICEYTGGSCATKHTLIASTTAAVSKTERSQVLSSADWGGSGFPNIANLRLGVNGSKVGGPDGSTSDMFDIRIDGEYSFVGSLSVDIVDSGGGSVSSPSMAMSAITFSFSDQSASGTFGVASEKIRVSNTTASAQWTLSVAADGGSTDFWDSAGTDYDFNDPTASAGDGGDADSLGGQMTVDASGGTITPEGGCSNTGLTLGSSASFSEGVTDSITLLTAGATAGTSCYWDLTDISISQTIPPEQPAASDYNIDMTVSVVAS
ncbi:MAG: hypothetical protein V1838_04305 [Patescibacteria group bacterium]